MNATTELRGEAHWWHLGLGWGLQLAALQARRRGDQSPGRRFAAAWRTAATCGMASACWNNTIPTGWPCAGFISQQTMHPRGSSIPFLSAGCRRPCCCSAAGGTRICEASLISRNAPRRRWPTGSAHRSSHPSPVVAAKQQLLLNFFQHHLQDHPSKDASDGVAITGVHLWDQTKARWERTHTTNPAHQPTEESSGWSLSSTGLACLDPSEGSLIKDGSDGSGSDGSGSEGSGQVVIVHDPWRPVPAVGGHLSPTAGPVDRASVDQRSDVALFTGAPVTHRLQLSGRPMLQLVGFADQPGFDLCVALSRLPLSPGCSATEHGCPAHHRTERPQPQAPDTRIAGIACHLEPGDRLRLPLQEPHGGA